MSMLPPYIFTVSWRVADQQPMRYNEDITRGMLQDAFRKIHLPSTDALADKSVMFLYDMDINHHVQKCRQEFARSIANMVERDILTYLARNDTAC